MTDKTNLTEVKGMTDLGPFGKCVIEKLVEGFQDRQKAYADSAGIPYARSKESMDFVKDSVAKAIDTYWVVQRLDRRPIEPQPPAAVLSCAAEYGLTDLTPPALSMAARNKALLPPRF